MFRSASGARQTFGDVALLQPLSAPRIEKFILAKWMKFVSLIPVKGAGFVT
jgi:hypothetical protein